MEFYNSPLETARQFGPTRAQEYRFSLVLKNAPTYWEDLHNTFDKIFPGWADYSGGALARCTIYSQDDNRGLVLVEITYVSYELMITEGTIKKCEELGIEVLGASGNWMKVKKLFDRLTV